MQDLITRGKNLLGRWLEKRGIKHVDELTPEERSDYDKYRLILTGEPVTIESLKNFMRIQVSLIESKFGEKGNENDTYYKACIHVYLSLLKAIEAPEAERKAAEVYLTQLIEAK